MEGGWSISASNGYLLEAGDQDLAGRSRLDVVDVEHFHTYGFWSSDLTLHNISSIQLPLCWDTTVSLSDAEMRGQIYWDHGIYLVDSVLETHNVTFYQHWNVAQLLDSTWNSTGEHTQLRPR